MIEGLVQKGRITALCRQLFCPRDIVCDGGQGLVGLMGQCGRQLAERRQAGDVKEFVLQLMHPRLGLLALRQIANEADKMMFARKFELADADFDGERRPVFVQPRQKPGSSENGRRLRVDLALQEVRMLLTIG